MPNVDYTRSELMIVVSACHLKNNNVCFVGIGKPSTAANLARLTHAPDIVLIYESGAIGAKPSILPLSIGDPELARTADTVVSIPEIFNYWLQGGRIDVGLLGAAQIDRHANINTTVIGGSYYRPKIRLPGAGGAPEIVASCKEAFIVLDQSHRSFVEKLDFITSAGYLDGSNARDWMCVPGKGPTNVITDLGVLKPNPESKELTLTNIHPGVTVDEVKKATGWKLKVADDLQETDAPKEYFEVLRELEAKTREAHARK